MAQREGSNGFDGEQLERYLDEIDKADDKLLKLKSDHMLACKAPRAAIKGVMKEARNAGVNMNAFRSVVAKHRSERKIEEQIAQLEADDHADYQQMLIALGDFGTTELGEAALKRAEPPADPAARKDEDALAQLGRG